MSLWSLNAPTTPGWYWHSPNGYDVDQARPVLVEHDKAGHLIARVAAGYPDWSIPDGCLWGPRVDGPPPLDHEQIALDLGAA